MPKKRQPQEKPEGQRALQTPNFLLRLVPAFQNPEWQNANMWRRAVRLQPICVVCRDTLIAFLLDLKWHIRARNPNDTDLYKNEIDYYVELFNTTDGMDFDTRIDLLCQDVLDISFGGASEVGRLGDTPNGRVVWMQHIDGATLYPTGDWDFPVGQRMPGVAVPAVLFPRHAIDRAYFSPRTEWDRKGWGMAPPEKIYLALDLLYRGDRYYANLLLDTPEAGILDLLDMSKESAKEWLESFKLLFTGADPFKVPILYEHSQAAKFIPFGRPPLELMFDTVTFKYAQICCAGYGLRISDIGLSKEEARTLAGVIRSERQTRRTGLAVLKSKIAAFHQFLLPKHLVFEWLDQDDEAMIARGRARLANMQAWGEARDKKLLHLEEIRSQIAADGLLDIQIDPDNTTGLELETGGATLRLPRTDQDRVPPSEGGEGELTFPRKSFAMLISKAFEKIVIRAQDIRFRRLTKAMIKELFPNISGVFKEMKPEDVDAWARMMIAASFGEADPQINRATIKKQKILDSHLEADKWWVVSKDLRADDLVRSYILIFEAELDSIATQVTQLLYEEGQRAVPEHELDISLTNTAIMGAFSKSANTLVEQIDKETPGLLKSVVMASVCHVFALPSVFNALKKDMRLEDLLEDKNFIKAALVEIRDGVEELFIARAAALVDQISQGVVHQAASEFLTRLGLGEKDWRLDEEKLVVNKDKLFRIVKRSPTFWAGG